MMTNKDCKDFADFVAVLQKKEKENKIQRPTKEDQKTMALS